MGKPNAECKPFLLATPEEILSQHREDLGKTYDRCCKMAPFDHNPLLKMSREEYIDKHSNQDVLKSVATNYAVLWQEWRRKWDARFIGD